MLPLSDREWKNLSHAFGSASNIPDMLQDLAASKTKSSDYREEPWFSLWSCLCHQDDIYTASFAAVPHIFDIASKVDGPVDSSFFQLPAAIEIARCKGNGPEIPDHLSVDYFSAFPILVATIHSRKKEEWDKDMLLAVLAAFAVAKGAHSIGDTILNLDAIES
jgi:hypothetical protein